MQQITKRGAKGSIPFILSLRDIATSEDGEMGLTMAEPFVSLLTSTDWNEEWKRLQIARKAADDARYWDEKAKTFPVKHGSQEGYAKRFLELADVKPGETVLDMGCGTGSLATPLALAGAHVIACDFSQGMLDKMCADQSELGIADVDVRLMSWADNWESHGLPPKSVDVALASRSIATADLQESLMKLDAVARRRACITLPCGPSPRTDERLMDAAGIPRRAGRDFVYAFNILVANGINPEVSYISSVRTDVFDTREEALASYTRMLEQALAGTATAEELATIPEHLEPWLEQNLVQDQRGFHLAEDRRITWAFIAWEPPKR